MSETEGGCPERVGSHGIDAAIVAVIESAALEPQIENFNNPFACCRNMNRTIKMISHER